MWFYRCRHSLESCCKAVGGAPCVARLQAGQRVCTFCLWYVCAPCAVAFPAALAAVSLSLVWLIGRCTLLFRCFRLITFFGCKWACTVLAALFSSVVCLVLFCWGFGIAAGCVSALSFFRLVFRFLPCCWLSLEDRLHLDAPSQFLVCLDNTLLQRSIGHHGNV